MKWLAILLTLTLPAVAQTTRITSGDSTNANGGLVGWWTFEDNAVNDRAGALNGTLVGSPAFVQSVIGNGGSFNGSSQNVYMADRITGLTSCTAAAWFKTTSSGAFIRIVSQGVYFRAQGFILRLRSGYPAFATGGVLAGFDDYAEMRGTALKTDDRWHHLTGTYDAGTKVMRLYVDGAITSVTSVGLDGTITDGGLSLTRSVAATLTSTAGDVLGIAAYKDGSTTQERFPGSIDEVRIYNRALSASEISQLYNSRKHLYGGD